jgi:mono/diheme cytochrome c family protein
MKINEKLPMQLALAAVAVNLLAFGLTLARPAEAAEPKKNPQVERGRYLVNTSGCHDCHTPLKMGANGPEPDMSRMLSGHPAGMQMPPVPALPQGPWLVVSAATNTAWAGPWGVSFTANLTPDAETGLGKWSAKDFRDTIRTGRHLGRGRAILPPMPIPAYSQMTDRDLEAIFAYLRTVPAVSNAVPEPWAPAAAPVAAK